MRIITWNKIKNNFDIYRSDINQYGLRYFLLARLIKIPILGNIYHYLKPKAVTVFGNIIYIDKKDKVVSETLILKGIWESHVTEVFQRFIHPGDIVIDVGAHIGYYSLLSAKIVGNKGKIYSFEPDKVNFTLLQKNISVNKFKNIITERKALGNQNKKDSLYLDHENSGDYRLYKSNRNVNEEIVNVVKLDDYFKNNRLSEKIHFIKMDIQGYETKALMGMERLIRKNKEVKIVTEFWPMGLKLAGESARKYYKLLEKLGFYCYEINQHQPLLELTSLESLLKKYPEDAIEGTNLLCLKYRL